MTGRRRDPIAASTLAVTSGPPSTSTSSLSSEPILVPSPAASTTPATAGTARRRSPVWRPALARRRPARDLREQSADAHSHDIGGADLQFGEQALQHPVEAVQLGRARAAGQADDRRFVEPGEQQQIARIDRHAEVDDLAAQRDDRRRDDVATVDGGRSSHHQNRVEAFARAAARTAASTAARW